MKFFRSALFACAGLALLLPAHAQVAPVTIKLVLVTDAAFAPGTAGTSLLNRWIQSEHLTQLLTVPGLDQPVHSDGMGTLAVVTGAGAGATAQVMAFATDPRFDLTHAYWLIAGSAAGNPDRASLGSAVWAQYVINGDEAYEIDRADAPNDWPYGIVPLAPAAPKNYPLAGAGRGENAVFPLNDRLAKLAFQLSRDDALPDNKQLIAERGEYAGYTSGPRPPAIAEGDIVASARYWHGKSLNQWAVDWAQYWTGSKAHFAVADTSDAAIAAALATLTKAQRIDFQRVMFLRAVANYTVDSGGRSHDQSRDANYPGFSLAEEAAFRASRPVIAEFRDQWPKHQALAP